MCCNIRCELIKRIKSSQGFALQVGESADVAHLSSALLAFVGYIKQAEEEVVMCKPLHTHSTGADISNLIDLYHHVCVTLWLQRSAYLAGIFTKISELNLSFQGMINTAILTHEQIENFLCITEIWRTSI
jgi:hypothetical protein